MGVGSLAAPAAGEAARSTGMHHGSPGDANGPGDASPQPAPVEPVHDDVEASVVRALLRGTSQTSWLLEADGTVRWVSPAVTRTLGYDAHEVAGWSILELLHPDDVAMSEALLSFAGTHPADGGFEHEGVDLAFDSRLRHRAGHYVSLENLVNNFLASPGIGAILLVQREVAGRRAMDDALTALAQGATDEALRRLLTFVEIRLRRSRIDTALYWPQGEPAWRRGNAPAALVRDEGPWAEAAAKGAYVLLDDLPTAVTDGVLHPDLERAATAAGYVACWCVPVPAPAHPGARFSYGLTAENPDPLATLVVWSRRYRRPGPGQWAVLERVAGLAYFAVARRVAEQERQAHLEREREQNRRLQELDAIKTDLVLSVSHELRTPLTSIISFAELLTDRPRTYTPTEQDEYLDIVARNAARLLRMVEDLLFLGRLESRMVNVVVATVELPDLVRGAVDAIGPVAEAKGVTVEHSLSPGAPLTGDAERLRQLVDNLLSNAVKYTGAGGQVGVAAEPVAGGWRLTVSDNGIGIAPGEQEQVFDRFFRGSNARRARIGGTGLGLAIARAVAELHHGTLELADTTDRGCTFVATLHSL